MILTVGLFASSFAEAKDYQPFGPFSVRNQNPVYLQTLSLTPKRAVVLSRGEISASIDSAYSNLYEQGENDIAKLDLDMEYWRISPRVSYGIARDMEVGIEIPFVHFNGGFLDAFIQKFHHFFGLPNGGRENVPNGRFSYELDAGGETKFLFSPADFGLGDISINFRNDLLKESKTRPGLQLFYELKFPTGRKSRGFGNGSVDFGMGAALEKSWKRLHGYFNVEYVVTGGNDKIDRYMQNEMLAYMIAGELSIIDDLAVVVQLDGSTPLLTKTRLDAWDGVPLDLIIGFRGYETHLIMGNDFFWQVGFSEDVTSAGPSVDFTAFISVGMKFKTGLANKD